MSFNVGKCHTICFSTNLDTTYVVNNHVLTQVHHHSYLGVILSEDLKWSEHIIAHNYNIKCQTNSGIIWRNFRNVSVDCKSKLYHNLVRPKIEYANSA